MTQSWSQRDIRRFIIIAALGIALVPFLFDAAAWAQANPFGGPRPPAAETGMVGWLLARQGDFFRRLSGLVRAAKADGTAVWTLVGISFLYGILHAAGPGHGKAVISSYMVANEETWRRGVVLSFASAFLQAAVAVAVVGIAAGLLQATARTMNAAVWWIEVVSYGLIALMGARLTFVKGRGFLHALRQRRQGAAEGAGAGAGEAAHVHDHSCAHHHDHGSHSHGAPSHAHHDDHHHDGHCGHSHGPEPADLAGPGGWRRGLTAIIAVGLRPCSGAILVLVFALAQGLFWAGVASTFAMGFGTAITVALIAMLAVGARSIAARFATNRDGSGTLILRAIETGAAVLVLAFGLALITGYMVAERMAGF
ncbi:nickel/cobalt transporter [Xanthobacteraceae bacterium Astr-EGSB]|uniref:nickel/cobalt transporter n=1 Tax=Astrobacterium formosum TaxID=3069710 RepID=UPI0027B4565F|nr:nickel/cobalt transporter [Xanthobacteraceae bacterium Astr-EGSB]